MIAPANRQAVVSWSDLDDILATIARAKAALEAIDMMVEHPAVPAHATDAAQEVCTHARSLLVNASEALEAVAAQCNPSSEGGRQHG